MDRVIIARIELLTEKIDEKRDQAARLLSSSESPARSYISETRGSHDLHRRERLLTEAIDQANALNKAADELQKELDDLSAELLSELQYLSWDLRTIIKGRLIKRYTWAECAELTGYCIRTCQNKYDKWLSALKN